MRPFIACLAIVAAALTAVPARADLARTLGPGATLNVCIWPDYFGITYRNPHTGRLQGLDIDLAQELARELGTALAHVETDFGAVLDDLEARRCHVAMMGMGDTAARRQRVDFSRPYLRSDVYAITTRSNRAIGSWDDIDRPGRVIVVQRGTVMEPLMRDLLRQAELRVATRPGEREAEVESGRADAFIADYPYSRRMLGQADWARVVAPPYPVQLTDYAYGVPKGEARWLARIDAFVAAIKRDGRLAAAAARHGLTPIAVLD
jgi:cyclohexadienyl dehydratase